MAISLRQTILGRLRQRLEQRGAPRLQMTLLVALTGGAGFVCSVALLHAGMTELWLRYPLSVAAAYLMFLMLLWWWMRISAPSYIDPRDLMGLTRVDQGWDDAWSERQRRGPSWDNVFDLLEELGLPLLLLAALSMLLFACCYIIYTAPVLFAELMLDGVLAATLYRRLRTLDSRHWLETALRRTFMTFFMSAVLLATAGAGMSYYAPGAHTLGEFLHEFL